MDSHFLDPSAMEMAAALNHKKKKTTVIKMAAIEAGRICVKKRGVDAGEEVTITKVIDDNFVMVKNAKGKESKCSIMHLEPTSKTA